MNKKDFKNMKMKVTLKAYYDIGFGEMEFEDNFQILRYSDRKAGIFNFTSCGILADFEIDFYKLTKKDILEILDDDDEYSMKNTKDELVEELLWDCDAKEFELLVEMSDELVEKLGFVIIETMGYSQGDFAYITINQDEYKRKTGIEFDVEKNQEYLHHLLWDSPIFIHFNLEFFENMDDGGKIVYEINGMDFLYIDEFMSNNYNIETLDVPKLMQTITKNLTLNKEQIKIITESFEDLTYEDIKFQI